MNWDTFLRYTVTFFLSFTFCKESLPILKTCFSKLVYTFKLG